MQRALTQGLARRTDLKVAHIGVDETSFRKRHDYVTIVSDATTGRVLHVGEDRMRTSVLGWHASLTSTQLAQIESASMDMWLVYTCATLAHVPDKESKSDLRPVPCGQMVAYGRGQGAAAGARDVDEGESRLPQGH